VLNSVRRMLGWGSPAFAGRIWAGTTPLGDLAAGKFVLFVSYLFCGLALPISPLFLLLLEEFGLQLQHLTPHSILQVAIFVHFCEMFGGVAACTSLFRQFFVLVRSGKGKDHLGAYYFQTRSDPTVTYIAYLGSARWENWWHDWVIATAEVSDRLALLSDGPRLGRKQLREKPCLVPEFEPILDRIKELAVGGLTWEQLEIFVRGITGEDFIPKSLMPPQGISPLCDNLGLRSAVLARLPTLDESGVAVRQTDGRDPHRGIHIPGAPVGGPQPADVAPRAPPAGPSSSDKGKGPACSSSTPDVAGRSEGVRRP
jgi:hypothetical protein